MSKLPEKRFLRKCPVLLVQGILIVSLFVCLSAQAEESSSLRTPEQVQGEANQLYDTVMSPYCPGRTLSACPSDDARRLREDIFSWLRDGSTVPEVIGRLKITYGEKISGEPGSPLVAWGIPAGIVVFIGLGLALLFGRGRTPAKVEESHDLRDKIEQELQKRLK